MSTSKDQEHRQTLWSHALRFGSPNEIVEALAEAGPDAKDLLGSPPPDISGGRTRFEIVWSRMRSEEADKKEAWAPVAKAMADAGARVNHRLPDGRLPLSEMMSWGSAFHDARAAFAEAGANVWKRGADRRSAADEARRLSMLSSESWLAKATKSSNFLATDSAKEDLVSGDYEGKHGRLVDATGWAERFAWERNKGFSTFDEDCLWKLTHQFSPAEALVSWRKAHPQGIEQRLLAQWLLRCIVEKREGLPSSKEARKAASGDFSILLGKAAVTMGTKDGSASDPDRSEQLIESVMDACDLAGVEFGPAATVLAEKAQSWLLPQQFGTDPFSKVFAGEQLLEALRKAWTHWEARRIGEVSGEVIARARPARL